METNETIREKFVELLNNEDYVIDKSGVKVLEIINANFKVTSDTIFGTLDKNYISRELEWYLSGSLNVNDIKEPIPKIWKMVASKDGFINSNYGNLVFKHGDISQYGYCLEELKNNPYSRRAVMHYSRPSIWLEYNKDGMSDYICCFNNQFFIRNNKLISIVNFRSNDACYGYKNDCFWFKYIHSLLANELDIEIGDMFWQANSLHIYEKHFNLIKN